MLTTVPVFGKFHSHSQYDRSGHLEICMKSRFPKSGSVIRSGDNQSLRLWRKAICATGRADYDTQRVGVRDSTARGCGRWRNIAVASMTKGQNVKSPDYVNYPGFRFRRYDPVRE